MDPEAQGVLTLLGGPSIEGVEEKRDRVKEEAFGGQRDWSSVPNDNL